MAAGSTRRRISTASPARACGSTTASAPTRSARPSRAAILTGTYNHVNGVYTLLDAFDGRQDTFPRPGCNRRATRRPSSASGTWGTAAMHDPTGFDDWAVLPGQGDYHDPEFISEAGRTRHRRLRRPTSSPTCRWTGCEGANRQAVPACLHHKAPHRPWEPDEKHAHMYEDIDIPEPRYLRRRSRTGRSAAAAERGDARSRTSISQTPNAPTRTGLTPEEVRQLGLPALHQGLPALRGEHRRQRRPGAGLPRCRGPRRGHRGDLHLRPGLLPRAITAGTTSGSCTRNRCACRSSSATRARSRRGRPATTSCTNVDFAPPFLDYAG